MGIKEDYIAAQKKLLNAQIQLEEAANAVAAQRIEYEKFALETFTEQCAEHGMFLSDDTVLTFRSQTGDLIHFTTELINEKIKEKIEALEVSE